jgi:hypothetical protein
MIPEASEQYRSKKVYSSGRGSNFKRMEPGGEVDVRARIVEAAS